MALLGRPRTFRVPSDMVLICQYPFVWRCQNDHLDRLYAPTDLHGASLESVGCHAGGLGSCHTHDHLACKRSRCQSRRDVDGITERREVVDSCARSGRPNERLACVDSRSCRNRIRPRGAGVCRSLGQVDCGCYRCCRMVRPVIPPKKSPITSSPTTLSTMPS
jgi:hypothetical protein